MLELDISGGEFYDEINEMFVSTEPVVLRLEHSLLSISKWESHWKKPFLSKDVKTQEETLDYIKCMTLNQHVDPHIYYALSNEHIRTIMEYVETDQTATWFSDKNSPPSREVVTSELIYYWLTAHNIPFECQKWHLSRLLTLVHICNIKNNPDQKKMRRSEIYSRNRKLNAARRKARASKG